MKSLLLVIMLLTAVPAIETAAAEADNPPDEDLPAVVVRGLTFISEKGAQFQNKKSCITCHHAPINIWAQRDPARLGFSVDVQAVNAFEDKLMERFQRASKGYDKKQWSHTLASFVILGQPDEWNPADQPQATAALLDAITRGQHEDGSWKAANQFSGQKRPAQEAATLQSMWNILALARLEVHDESLAARREKALEWLRRAPAPVSMDARAVRLLIEHRFGEPSAAGQMLSDLLEDQNEDGSWGWVAGGQGDAWATGSALYVLSFLGDKVPTPSIESAQSYLASSQSEDGSWTVPTKLKGKNHKPQISSYFGTAWSVMGLARTMPRE